MAKIASQSLLLCLFFVFGATSAEEPLVCYDGPFENVLLDGCVDDCKSFETLAEAEAHCNMLELCGGITKSAYGDEEAMQLGVGLYEVRQGPGIEAAKGDTTWIKQVDCQGGTLPDESEVNQQYVGDETEHPTTVEEGDQCYTYSASVQGHYLEGCIDECASFPTLQEAQDHCDNIPDCGGVTHSLYGEGQVWHSGNGPYEVRLGPTLKPSVDGDISWIRIEHPCNDLGVYHGAWNNEYDTQAGGGFTTSIIYLFILISFFIGMIFVSYRMGHPITVDYVDKARDKLKDLLDRQGTRQASGAYESL